MMKVSKQTVRVAMIHVQRIGFAPHHLVCVSSGGLEKAIMLAVS